jgi:nifR3 family TIM-barrel protein
MELGFWKNIKKPFFAMAPMADVTDAAFRRMFVKYGKPDVTWTEFVSADGLCLAPEEGKKRLMRAFDFVEEERPIVAQIFGSNPEYIEKASALVRELGFDGVDLNMGCPDKGVEKGKAGAAMIKNPELAKEIILAAKRGAKEMPVSVKTRLGYNKDELEKWLPKILEAEPALVTIHARTRKEMSDVPARWERVKRAVEIRDEIQGDYKTKTLIAGNGDVTSREDGLLKIKESGADGVMVGRGIFGNPQFFCVSQLELGGTQFQGRSTTVRAVVKRFFSRKILGTRVSVSQRLAMLTEHTKLFEKLCEYKNFAVMKKHYKAYCHGFLGAKELRIKLMEAESGEEVEKLVDEFLTNN